MSHSDPRFKNLVFPGETAYSYFESYKKALNDALSSINEDAVNTAFNKIKTAFENSKQIFILGNGGSAAIANHLSCDFSKGTLSKNSNPLKIISLSNNIPVISAIANDYGYEYIFSTQLEMIAQPGDLLIAISSSGNSPNIVKACEFCHKNSLEIIGVTGFSGGKLKEMSQVSLHVPFDNYGVVEDAHQAVLQCLAQFIAKYRDQKN